MVFLWFSHGFPIFPSGFPVVFPFSHGFSHGQNPWLFHPPRSARWSPRPRPEGRYLRSRPLGCCRSPRCFFVEKGLIYGMFFVFWKGLCVFLMKTWELGEVRDFFCGLKRAVFFYGEEILDLGKGILVGKISKKRLIGLEYGDCLFVF